MLERIRIVMIETSHPGNIGAAARAMKTMGLSDLCLVKPKNFPSAEATARASGADDVLHAAMVVDDLEAAVKDCHLVIGSSARLRSRTWPMLSSREFAEKVRSESDATKVAIVFGRESSGLSNAELDRCNYLVRIPVNEEYSSLNVASAVQIFCYELRVAALQEESMSLPERDEPLANHDQLEGFYEHLRHALYEWKYLNEPMEPSLMRRLRRLYGRAELSEHEINILRGILKAGLQHQPSKD